MTTANQKKPSHWFECLAEQNEPAVLLEYLQAAAIVDWCLAALSRAEEEEQKAARKLEGYATRQWTAEEIAEAKSRFRLATGKQVK